ncbi:hypothetical protein KSP39_PZI001773 [Platanthera zijinensis]|uniref:Retrotransposon Copia-like N-terminal domain-containing protein n=1 Tax=Platanthera zijinensis TaxID=2320716 RepID=A0AAP0BZ28_9ASPA
MDDQSIVSPTSQSGALSGISAPLTDAHAVSTIDPPRSYGPSVLLKITTVALDGTNYLKWSRAAQHAIRSHQLYGLIDGTTTEPPHTDFSWRKWDADNSLVVSWLLHSMSPQVYHSYMLLDSAYDIWIRARDTYFQAGSSMQVYELTRRVLELKKGTMTVAAYYSEFERLYQELDFFNTFTAACTADAKDLQKDKDRFRVHVFLMGLNMEFDVVRQHVLHREPLPSFREAFGMPLSDENHRHTLGSTTDHSALAGISPLLDFQMYANYVDVNLYISYKETICSCASMGFVGTYGSTITERILLMRKNNAEVVICLRGREGGGNRVSLSDGAKIFRA